MRGEEQKTRSFGFFFWEIPPHARRRVASLDCACGREGNTSACAEKRAEPMDEVKLTGKYLRMRGEELTSRRLPCALTEIPPHARRRGGRALESLLQAGNTSACAEKRKTKCRRSPATRKYLRMRGEEVRASTSAMPWSEIPPHARRRARRFDSSSPLAGNTSACAEKSKSGEPLPMQCRKYLRMRGEENHSALTTLTS